MTSTLIRSRLPFALLLTAVLHQQSFGHDRPIFEGMTTEPTEQVASDVPSRILLSWKNDPATSFSVTWRSLSSPDAVAEIAVASDGPAFAHDAILIKASTDPLKTRAGDVHMHAVTFTELKPNTKYAYRVGCRRTKKLPKGAAGHDLTEDFAWSEWFHCTTTKQFTGKVEPVRFVYVGDAQNDLKSHWSRLIREAYADAPDMTFMLHAGDLVNRGNNDNEWGQWFYALGWISGTIPQLAVPGNHEYDRDEFADVKPGQRIGSSLSRRWPLRFELPENGPEGTSENVYYVDVQGVRIIGLDSNRDLEQAKWLEGVLKDNPNRWTIVTHHHPIYSASGNRDNAGLRETFQPIYDKYGVDIVLQGHDHTYGRSSTIQYGDVEARGVDNKRTGLQVFDPDGGTVYVVSVSGPKMYGLKKYKTEKENPFEVRSEGRQLYQVITVEHDRLLFEARTATGRLYDSFTLQKDAQGTNTLIEAKQNQQGNKAAALTP